MKKLLIFIVGILIFASCNVKKSITSSVIKKDSVSEKTSDSLIVKSRLIINPDIKVKTDIDLNTLDLFKNFYNEQHPYTIYDSTGQTQVTTYIDKNNHLKQDIKTKPKSILVSDTTKIHNSKKQEISNTTIKEKEIIVKKPNFFEKIWSTIKSFIWIIVIISLSIGLAYILYKFNIIGLIKKLITKKN